MPCTKEHRKCDCGKSNCSEDYLTCDNSYYNKLGRLVKITDFNTEGLNVTADRISEHTDVAPIMPCKMTEEERHHHDELYNSIKFRSSCITDFNTEGLNVTADLANYPCNCNNINCICEHPNRWKTIVGEPNMDMMDKFKPCICDLFPCTCGALDEVNIKELLKFLDNEEVQAKIMEIIVDNISRNGVLSLLHPSVSSIIIPINREAK